MRSKKMNGPTSRRFAEGSARRTSKPPMSCARGTIIVSMASQAKASPGTGSGPGKKLIDAHPSSGPGNYADIIARQVAVVCHETHVLDDRLRQHQPIERVGVQGWQPL